MIGGYDEVVVYDVLNGMDNDFVCFSDLEVLNRVLEVGLK